MDVSAIRPYECAFFVKDKDRSRLHYATNWERNSSYDGGGRRYYQTRSVGDIIRIDEVSGQWEIAKVHAGDFNREVASYTVRNIKTWESRVIEPHQISQFLPDESLKAGPDSLGAGIIRLGASNSAAFFDTEDGIIEGTFSRSTQVLHHHDGWLFAQRRVGV